MKILQYLLTKSYYAKLLAVKKVISNKGSKTPGVDDEIWNSDKKRYQGATNLNNKEYKAKPLRRTYLKKPNGKLRPLGIPTMYDRAMQALHALALDPVADTVLRGERGSNPSDLPDLRATKVLRIKVVKRRKIQ